MTKSRQVKLAECVDLLSGFAFKSQQFTDNVDDVHLVKGENVSQGRVLWDISKRWPASDWENFEKFQLSPGDVVIAMDRPWVPAGLKWCFVRPHDPKSLLVQRCCRLRANPNLMDQTFLRCVIGGPGFESYIKPITTGVNIPHISGKQILDFACPLPSLPTQRKIAGILSAYDDLIENNLCRIKILEEMAQSLYREWFVHFRFPGHKIVKLVDSALGKIPKGWEVKTLGELADQMRRGIPKGELDQPVPYVGLEHIPRQSLALDAWEETTELGSNKLTFERGEVLFGKIRPYFHKVSAAPFAGICSADTIVIRSKKPEHRALVTSCVFTEAFVAHATATSNGSKMPRTDWKVLKDYPLVLPPKDIIIRFSMLFENSISQQQNLIFRNQTLRQTRDLLLPKLIAPVSHAE